MENVEIARILGDYADLLAIQGANPFSVRAYQDARGRSSAWRLGLRATRSRFAFAGAAGSHRGWR